MTQNLPCVVGNGLITFLSLPSQLSQILMKVVQNAQSRHPEICLEKDEKWVAIAAMWLSNENLHEEAGDP